MHALQEWPPLLLGALRALPAGLLLLAVKTNTAEKRRVANHFHSRPDQHCDHGLIFVMALTPAFRDFGRGYDLCACVRNDLPLGMEKQRPHLIQALSVLIGHLGVDSIQPKPNRIEPYRFRCNVCRNHVYRYRQQHYQIIG